VHIVKETVKARPGVAWVSTCGGCWILCREPQNNQSLAQKVMWPPSSSQSDGHIIWWEHLSRLRASPIGCNWGSVAVAVAREESESWLGLILAAQHSQGRGFIFPPTFFFFRKSLLETTYQSETKRWKKKKIVALNNSLCVISLWRNSFLLVTRFVLIFFIYF